MLLVLVLREETGDCSSGEHSDSKKDSEERAEVGTGEVYDEKDVDDEGFLNEGFVSYHGYFRLID